MKELEEIDKKIRLAHGVVLFVMVATAFAYSLWFHDHHISGDSNHWGQFGAYFGGILSPVVAYAAFYWLTKAVRLQKEELFHTRVALESASESQASQASFAQKTVRVNAHAALISSIMGEVETQRLQLQFVVEQMRSDPNSARTLGGDVKEGKDLADFLTTVNKRISDRLTERAKYEKELVNLLNSGEP